MPINTDLNIAPYFDDFDLEKQFYKILFKPAYAVQARELTQLQTILQNQIEQFGDNVYKEGSIIKGCTFTTLDSLEYVKLVDQTDAAGNTFDVESYIGGLTTEIISGVETEVDVVYELTGVQSGLTASIIFATRGFETRPPNLNTFYINYLTTNEGGVSSKKFIPGETLRITRKKYIGSTLYSTEANIQSIAVTLQSNATGKSYGLQAAPGVVFQKGHFLFADTQTLIVSKYDNNPDGVSVGYSVSESLVSSLQDNSLYDNANGSTNENAPGADRLKLVPVLVAKPTAEADVDENFFTLARYENGSAVSLRDVSQFNSIAEELARRTYEESGDYILEDFIVNTDRRGADLKALVGTGTAYVRGYRVENRGLRSFTIPPVSNTEIVQNQAVSFDYGSYVDLVDISGLVDINYDTANLLAGDGATKIGEAIIRNMTPSRIYLFGVKMTAANTTFGEVNYIQSSGGLIGIANNSIIKEVSKAPVIFPTGLRSLKETSDTSIPIRTSVSASVVSDTIIVNAVGNEDFGASNDDMVFVDATNTQIPILSYSTSLGNSVLTINLDPAASSAPAGELYFNKNIQVASPYSKEAVAPFIKVNYTTTQTKYSLGFPDVYAIEDIYDSGGTRYTDSFRLKTNQKDHYYDISYMEYIPGTPKPANGVLTIKLNVFEINPSTGKYFFTINSYPIDDVTDPLPAGKVRSNQIPVYVGTNRKTYNLRECFDFRPYADKDPLANYTAITAGSAPTITASADGASPTFSGTNYVIPAINQSATTDIEHYLSRIDLITIDSYGKFSLVTGPESSTPAPPKIGADILAISEIRVPGYPALSAKEAADQKKPEYAVKARARGVKNYTMKDIAKIERKVESLEYYISLNQLEQQVENLLIQDENGLTRFKNGYIVDPFNDINLGNLEDTDFSAAVHFDKKILTPSLKTFPLDLRYKSRANASIFPSLSNPDVASLSRNNHVKLLGQNYATNFRNCVSNFYDYAGEGTLVPNHDMVHDTTTNPVNLEIDIATPFNQFVENLQQFIPMTGSVTRNIGSRQIRPAADWFPSDVIETTTNTLAVNDPTTRTQQVGDFVSNLEFRPFMRSRDIKVYMYGLRPNTRHYFFFDEVDVNAHITPGTTVDEARDVQPFGNAGDPVVSDASGVIRAIFTIPEETFFVGERVLVVTDVDQLDSIESAATSHGRVTYHAYNIGVDKSSLTATTRVPQTSIVTTTTTRTLPARPRPQPPNNNDGGPDPAPCGGCDPLSQTFFIKDGMGRGSNTVFASKVDLYFKRKSEVNGVSVMLREVLNGYPTSMIIPFSKIHLTPDQVNVSDDASAVTTVDFDAPIRLDTEKEYCIVVHPDANDPNYLIFTSKIGGYDLSPGVTQGQPVVQDWGDGVLFTSTNNRAWTAYQDEDIKFALYRHDFNASTGTVTLTNADHEFLTLSDWTGRFLVGEQVYQTVGSAATMNVPLNASNVTASGVDLSTIYSVGDYVRISNTTASRSEIFRIVSIDSATEMAIDRPISFTVSNGTGTPVVVGEVVYYNKIEPDTIYLKNSSVTSSKLFTTSSIINGVRSGTTGTIGSIDNINLSYVQPLIMKSNDSVTTTSLNGTFVDPSNPINTYNITMKFGDNNYFTQKGVLLYSKSNDPTRAKPFDINVSLANRANSTSSPIVDLETSALLAYQFKSTNDAATTSKYISKTIELAADLDAEDMEVILTGHRPIGTDIKVYIKPQNSFDSANFESNDWIELEMYSGSGIFCSSINIDDYREYKYRVKADNKNAEGVITYTNSTTGTFSSYRKFAIRIDLISENIHIVPTVKDYRGIALT
jgi:hypothetical protein